MHENCSMSEIYTISVSVVVVVAITAIQHHVIHGNSSHNATFVVLCNAITHFRAHFLKSFSGSM